MDRNRNAPESAALQPAFPHWVIEGARGHDGDQGPNALALASWVLGGVPGPGTVFRTFALPALVAPRAPSDLGPDPGETYQLGRGQIIWALEDGVYAAGSDPRADGLVAGW